MVVNVYPGFYEVVIQDFEIGPEGLRLYGVADGLALSFTARQVTARLGPHDKLGWPSGRACRGGKEVR